MEDNILIDMFSSFLYIRRVEEKIVELYPEQEMRCPVHLSIGQEAIAVGVCKNLGKNDSIFSGHRSHAHYLAKEGDIKKFFAELYGKKTGCSKGRGGSMHLIDLGVNFHGATSIISGTIPLAVGIAFSKKMQNKEGIVVVFFGDGAIEEGTFTESLNYAALKKLPVLFICENNHYASQTPISKRQPKRHSIEIPKSYTIKSYLGNGNDIMEVYELSKKAIETMKNKGGPAFIEFDTYRWLEHCGPYCDTHLGYRTPEEVKFAKNNCSLKKLKNYLLDKALLNKEAIKRIEEEINIRIEKAVKFAKESKYPDKESLSKYIYSK